MSYSFTHESCSKRITLARTWPGQRVRCPRCGEQVAVPAGAVPTHERPRYWSPVPYVFQAVTLVLLASVIGMIVVLHDRATLRDDVIDRMDERMSRLEARHPGEVRATRELEEYLAPPRGITTYDEADAALVCIEKMRDEVVGRVTRLGRTLRIAEGAPPEQRRGLLESWETWRTRFEADVIDRSRDHGVDIERGVTVAGAAAFRRAFEILKSLPYELSRPWHGGDATTAQDLLRELESKLAESRRARDLLP